MTQQLPDFAQLRAEMVEQQLIARGIEDTAVLQAMRTVPRHFFVPQPYRAAAYKDRALPLFDKQTISQPFIVALMLSHLQLRPTDKVLEIGAGSGYAAAVISQLAKQVFTIERLPKLAEYARERLQKGQFDNVTVISADGTLGLPSEAPFDVIIAAASGPRVPLYWLAQLGENGRLIMPVGKRKKQRLVLVKRQPDGSFIKKELSPVRFVPLIGEQGWRQK